MKKETELKKIRNYIAALGGKRLANSIQPRMERDQHDRICQTIGINSSPA